MIGEALAAGLALEWMLHAESDHADPALVQLFAAATAAGAEVIPCEAGLLRGVGDLDSPSDVLAWAARPASAPTALLDALVPGAWLMVAAGVQDPGNLGALARVAAGLGAAGFVAGAGSTSPWHPRALRGASGTSLRLPVSERVDLADCLREARARGALAWAASADGEDARPLARAWRARGAPPILLLLGEEGRGVPRELADACDARVAVPLARGVESLNVATAGAVLAWELFARGASA